MARRPFAKLLSNRPEIPSRFGTEVLPFHLRQAFKLSVVCATLFHGSVPYEAGTTLLACRFWRLQESGRP
jgi:hypothetical protein